MAQLRSCVLFTNLYQRTTSTPKSTPSGDFEDELPATIDIHTTRRATRAMATPKPKPKPTPRKASTETHNRRVSKRLRQKLNCEEPAMPLTPVKTPTRGPFIPDTVEVHGVELEVRRDEVMVPEVGQFEAKEVDTNVMSLADIKRKTAEIELRNAIKAGKLIDLKLEVEMEKLKATR